MLCTQNPTRELIDMTVWSIVAVNVGAAAAVISAGLVAHALFFIALRRFAARSHILLDKSISVHCAAPLRLIFPLLALDIALPSLDINSSVDVLLQHVVAFVADRSHGVVDNPRHGSGRGSAR
jgi:hypothetical protein